MQFSKDRKPTRRIVAGAICCLLASQVFAAPPATWLGASDGNWSDPTRWSNGIVPTLPNVTDATIDAVGSEYNVTVNGGGYVLSSLSLDSADATLSIASDSALTLGELSLHDGTVRLAGLHDTYSTGSGLSASSISGNGQVLFDGASSNILTGATTLNIGSGITVRTGSGYGSIGYDPWTLGRGGPNITNNGIIASETGKAIYIYGTSFTNNGELHVGDNSSVYVYAGARTATFGTIVRTPASSLYLCGAIDNTNTVLDPVNFAGDTTLYGATITGGTLRQTSNPFRFVGTTTLIGVTVDADLDLVSADSHANLTLPNGLTLNDHTITMAGGTISISGALDGAGEIVNNQYPSSSGFATRIYGDNLVIGPDITIRTGAPATYGSGGLILGWRESTWTNRGLIWAMSGDSVQFDGNHWRNEGTIRVSDGTLMIGGTITSAAIGKIERTGGQILVNGRIDNTDNTIAFSPQTGSWQLDGTTQWVGRIDGGQITGTGGAGLSILSDQEGTLDGVTLAAPLLVDRWSILHVYDSLKLDGATITLRGGNGADSWASTRLSIDDSVQAVTIDGNGEIVFDLNAYNSFSSSFGGAGVTLGSGITLRTAGGGGIIHCPGGLTNNGIIRDDNGLTLTIRQSLTNKGTLEALHGGRIDITPYGTDPGSLVNAGLLHVGKDSTLTVQGTFTNTGTIKGNGTIIVSSFASSGTISPGESPGSLNIVGDLALSSDSVLEMEIGGTTPGVDFDVLNVSGNLALGGTLKLELVNGYVPSSDDVFDFLNFASSSGQFANVVLPPLPSGMSWDLQSLQSGGPAEVPEPAMIGVVAVSSLVLTRRHGRASHTTSRQSK